MANRGKAAKASLLPPELVSLVNYLELNKAGWWDTALKRFIFAALWVSNKPQLRREVKSYVVTTLAVPVADSLLDSTITALVRAGELLELPDGRLKVADAVYGRFEADLQAAARVAEEAQRIFVSSLSTCCPEVATIDTWKRFNENFLLPWIKSNGARVYLFVQGDPFDVEAIQTLPRFLADFDSVHRDGLRLAIRRFVEPITPPVRSYILGYLSTYFVLEASRLPETALHAIATANKQPVFKVFVDTNFVFSLLSLHTNPSNESAASLIDVVSGLEHSVNIKLYVAPPTIDETKGALNSRVKPLKNINFAPNLAHAAEDHLGGIEKRYVEVCREQNRWIDPDDYFGPYLKDLVPILRSHGMELYNDSLDSYRMRQDVIDDVLMRHEFEKKQYGSYAKTYEALLHDIVLWHFVQDQRPAVVESPLDAVFWIVTVDNRFMGFDSFKRRDNSVPVCIHPAAFVQLLQFWIPRTPDFDNALFGSLGLGSLFIGSMDTEGMTLRILNALSNFENIQDLSTETVARILTSDTLRRKLRSDDNTEREVALVREALIEENNRIAAALSVAAKRQRQLEEAVAVKQQELSAVKSSATDELTETRASLEREREEKNALAEKLEALEQVVNADRFESSRQRERVAVALFGVGAIAVAVLITLALHSIPNTLLSPVRLEPSFTSALGASLGVVLWLLAAEWGGRRVAVISNSSSFGRLRELRAWLLGTGGLGTLGITLYVEYLKSTF